MRKLLIPFLLMILQSCSTHHAVHIPKEPCLYPLKNYDFTLCEPFLFSIDNTFYSIPKGFETDLASIPRILWILYSPAKAETIPGAVIHDYFYSGALTIDRQEADSVLYDALVYEGVSRITAFKYWLAVRAFGGRYFKQRIEHEKYND